MNLRAQNKTSHVLARIVESDTLVLEVISYCFDFAMHESHEEHELTGRSSATLNTPKDMSASPSLLKKMTKDQASLWSTTIDVSMARDKQRAEDSRCANSATPEKSAFRLRLIALDQPYLGPRAHEISDSPIMQRAMGGSYPCFLVYPFVASADLDVEKEAETEQFPKEYAHCGPLTKNVSTKQGRWKRMDEPYVAPVGPLPNRSALLLLQAGWIFDT